ncbi:hypothetical protein EXN66_Car003286 [Channa argus]|uniref:Uncharacterized protein n=1 Tax=Channa argus TaxID=215402 RepID=A0A6G1PBW1_CHAAH|nr:hypothetical protein EXN66_Car003286 [Channa argus]
MEPASLPVPHFYFVNTYSCSTVISATSHTSSVLISFTCSPPYLDPALPMGPCQILVMPPCMPSY